MVSVPGDNKVIIASLECLQGKPRYFSNLSFIQRGKQILYLSLKRFHLPPFPVISNTKVSFVSGAV